VFRVSSRSVIRAQTVGSSSSSMNLTGIVAVFFSFLFLFFAPFSFFLYLQGEGEVEDESLAPVFVGNFLEFLAFPLRSFCIFYFYFLIRRNYSSIYSF
jgi:hypothetical protein